MKNFQFFSVMGDTWETDLPKRRLETDSGLTIKEKKYKNLKKLKIKNSKKMLKFKKQINQWSNSNNSILNQYFNGQWV